MSLLERVEAATGPDRELDEDIALALCCESQFMELADAPAGTGCTFYRYRDSDQWESALRVTASIDAALALVERVLPGWRWQVTNLVPRGGAAYVWDGVYSTGRHDAATPSLAILAALLSAQAVLNPAEPT